jgi:hypothetical protein
MATADRQLDLAYAAGVIDSDGSIGIHRKKFEHCQTCYEPRVYVRQVEIEAVELLYGLFGGYRLSPRSYVQNGKPLHEWRVSGQVACSALNELLPYLRIKKARAENALELGRLNATPNFRPPLAVDESEGWVSIKEAALLVGRPYQSINGAVWKGMIPSVGRRQTRRVPLTTVKTWLMRKPGGPTRLPERTAQLDQLYWRSRELNKVGVA